MVLKKTFLSLFNSALGCLLAGYILFLSFSAFFEFLGLTGFVFHERFYLAYFPAAGVVLVLVLLFALLNYIKKRLKASGYVIKIPEGAVKTVGMIIFVFEVLLGLYLVYDQCRLLMANSETWAANIDEIANIGSPYNFSGNVPEHIYHLLTGFVFSVFGYRPFVYMVLGAGLWFLGAFFAFFAVRALFGIVPALVSYMMLFTYACLYTNGHCFLNVQDNIMFVITVFLAMVISLIVRLRHDGVMISAANFLFFAISGSLLGFVSGFYPGALLITIPLLIAILFDSIDFTELDKVYENAREFAINRPLLPSLSFVIATVLGFFGFTLFNRMVHGYSLEASILSFTQKIVIHEFSIPDADRFLWFYMNRYIALTIVICIFAFFAFLETFFSRKDRASLYLWCVIPGVFLLFFTNIYSNADFYLFGIVSALAACGLLSMFRYEPGVEPSEVTLISKEEYLEKTAENSEDSDAVVNDQTNIDVSTEEDETVSSDNKEEDIHEDNVKDEKTSEETSPEETTIEESAADETASGKTTLEDSSSDETAPEKAPSKETPVTHVTPVKLFENPLPLPKKHEKREITFDFDVPDYLMKFDKDIKSDDDFDI